MAYLWQRWMAYEFRAAGLDVIEVAGWENRGRPASTGGLDPRGLNIHHVGVRSSAANPAPGVAVLVDGRPDLRGPVAHFGVDYHGRVWVIAAGRANVNGRNGGVPGIPAGDGNSDLLGDEVFTDGRQPLPAGQREAVAITSAVTLRVLGRSTDSLWRHADTSTTGKWDLGQLSTAQLRADVAAYNSRPPIPAAPLKEDDDMKRFDIIVTLDGGIWAGGEGDLRLLDGTQWLVLQRMGYSTADFGHPVTTGECLSLRDVYRRAAPSGGVA